MKNMEMMDKEDAIKLHVAGATVRAQTPFSNLQSLENGYQLTPDFLAEWVRPFYHEIGHTDQQWVKILTSRKSGITEEVISKCLGDFNWRTRQTGAFFSAITNQKQFIKPIGEHLLKSEVCYAGGVYCMVLASFNTKDCVDYLNTYLNYYLTRTDLWFDQREAMEAILYLDKINQTQYFERHQHLWLKFIENKTNWNRDIATTNLEAQLALIEKVRHS
jgi:hypothetical protein